MLRDNDVSEFQFVCQLARNEEVRALRDYLDIPKHHLNAQTKYTRLATLLNLIEHGRNPLSQLSYEGNSRAVSCLLSILVDRYNINHDTEYLCHAIKGFTEGGYEQETENIFIHIRQNGQMTKKNIARCLTSQAEGLVLRGVTDSAIRLVELSGAAADRIIFSLARTKQTSLTTTLIKKWGSLQKDGTALLATAAANGYAYAGLPEMVEAMQALGASDRLIGYYFILGGSNEQYNLFIKDKKQAQKMALAYIILRSKEEILKIQAGQHVPDKILVSYCADNNWFSLAKEIIHQYDNQSSERESLIKAALVSYASRGMVNQVNELIENNDSREFATRVYFYTGWIGHASDLASQHECSHKYLQGEIESNRISPRTLESLYRILSHINGFRYQTIFLSMLHSHLHLAKSAMLFSSDHAFRRNPVMVHFEIPYDFLNVLMKQYRSVHFKILPNISLAHGNLNIHSTIALHDRAVRPWLLQGTKIFSQDIFHKITCILTALTLNDSKNLYTEVCKNTFHGSRLSLFSRQAAPDEHAELDCRYRDAYTRRIGINQ